MSRFKSRSWQLAVAIGLCSSLWLEAALAQFNSGSYQPSGAIGTPQRTQGGASRGNRTSDCPVPTGSVIVAIIPENGFGVTLQSHPTFLFHLPSLNADAPPPQMEFVLRDKDDNDLYRVRFLLNSGGGIARIKLQDTMGYRGLEANQEYQWSVAMICRPSDRSRDIVAAGLIRRVPAPPELANLTTTPSIERVEALSRAGIWYDAIADLADLQRVNPTVTSNQWQSLLQAVGLQNIARESFINGSERLASTIPQN